MKKSIFALLLSVFTLNLGAYSPSGMESCGSGYDPIPGETVKRPVICSDCGVNSGWLVVDIKDGIYYYKCLNCNSIDKG